MSHFLNDPNQAERSKTKTPIESSPVDGQRGADSADSAATGVDWPVQANKADGSGLEASSSVELGSINPPASTRPDSSPSGISDTPVPNSADLPNSSENRPAKNQPGTESYATGNNALNPPRQSRQSTISEEATDPNFNRPNKAVAQAVFYPATGILLLLVILAIVASDGFSQAISWISSTVINNISWYYVLIATGFVIFVLVLAFSRFGDIKLGKDDEEPEYSLGSWFAMLFAAGMGIGLVFYGAGEPLSHFASPRPGTTGSDSVLAKEAMASTFLHWGLHPWAIYVVVSLGIAYAHFRRGRPVSIRWALEPLLGEKRVRGGLGHTIDTVAVLGTVLGIATSLGFGVNQVAAGIEYLTGFEATKTVLVVLVVVISALAAISVATGIDNGIKLLSNCNLILAALMAFAVAALGPTTFILNEFVQDIGVYLSDFFRMAFQTLPFQGVKGTTWLSSWTTYYWGWWISWSPFVGVFIARISRGRTIRQFIVGVMGIPTLVTFAWFAILGGNGLYQQMFGKGNLIDSSGLVNVNTVLFQSFEALPLSKILSGMAMIVVIIFFITSSDSGSYVMAMLSTSGDPNPPLYVRLTWATMAGLVTAVILGTAHSDSGMAALQALAILAAFPFSFVMIGICVSSWRSLSKEHRYLMEQERRLRRQMLVQNVSAQVVTQLESAVSQSVSTQSSAHTVGASPRSHSPIPLAPELVKVFRRAKRGLGKNTSRTSGSRREE